MDNNEVRLFREQEAMAYCGMGRTAFRRFAEEADAIRRFGFSVRYDKKAIDAAIDAAKQPKEA